MACRSWILLYTRPDVRGSWGLRRTPGASARHSFGKHPSMSADMLFGRTSDRRGHQLGQWGFTARAKAGREHLEKHHEGRRSPECTTKRYKRRDTQRLCAGRPEVDWAVRRGALHLIDPLLRERLGDAYRAAT
jgi:hypothetical protein